MPWPEEVDVDTPAPIGDEWLCVSHLPPPGERPAWLIVLVEGEKEHTGIRWLRQHVGFAATANDGFDDVDIRFIEKRGDMDRGSGRVTHWMYARLPNYPRAR